MRSPIERLIDATKPDVAYMIGFFQADGHLSQGSQNRGKFTLELNKRDEHILYSFQELVPCYSSVIPRHRDTNFKDDCDTSTLTISDWGYRTALNEIGISYGKKSASMRPITVAHSRYDYFRGHLDGNGSVGNTEKGYPFISLTTFSDHIAAAYKQLILETTGMVNKASRNKRDNIFNIVMFREDAQTVIEKLYYKDCLSLNRKNEAAQIALLWVRPAHWRVKSTQRDWTSDQDEFIMGHSINVSMEYLKRSKKSIQIRLWRLKKNV